MLHRSLGHVERGSTDPPDRSVEEPSVQRHIECQVERSQRDLEAFAIDAWGAPAAVRAGRSVWPSVRASVRPIRPGFAQRPLRPAPLADCNALDRAWSLMPRVWSDRSATTCAFWVPWDELQDSWLVYASH
jgi:hypothetical protein